MKNTYSLTLYRSINSGIEPTDSFPETILGYRVYVYKPNIKNIDEFGLKPLVNIIWYIFSKGKFYVLLLLDGKKVVHYSYITPKVFRFPFMQRNDVQVGPCETNPDYQGKGIFTEVLSQIIKYYAKHDVTVWTYTTLTNLASQKAFVRAGFIFHSLSSMNKYSKIIKTDNE